MTDLRDVILSIFEEDDSRRATAGHLIDTLDRRDVAFTVDEFDRAVSDLRKEGEVRVKNPRAPIYDKVILRTK